MGTRSAIARDNDHKGRARYVHWDGYPTGVGRALLAIVKRDGLDTARRVLTEEHFGWSSVTAEPNPDDRSDGGRFVNVPGYGTAYSHEEHRDEWAQAVDSEEYGYILADDGLVLIDNHTGTTRTVAWDTDPSTLED